MFNPRTIHIFDPDLVGVGGHNLPMDASLARECISRNITVTIYCRVGANINLDGLNVHELFRCGIFLEVPSNSQNFNAFKNYFLVNRIFFQDLNSLSSERFSSQDLIYFPNLTQNQIEGVADWVISLPETRRPIIAITLRYMSWAMQYNSARGYGPAIEFIYSNVLPKLQERHARTFFFSDTPVLAENFSRLSGAPVINLPSPQLARTPFTRPKPLSDPYLNLLFIGGWADVHGSFFMHEIVMQVTASFSHVSFTIQINADSEEKQQDLKLMQDLAKHIGPRLTVLEGKLSVDAYEATINSADIVLLPYQPANYSFASSGVFAEAAGLGKVLAVTAGTTLAASAKAYELGAVIIPEFNASACVQAVSNAITDFQKLDAKAKTSRQRYATENSPKGFFDAMFSHIDKVLK